MTSTEPATTTGARAAHPTGLRRSARLIDLYRREPRDPVPFYEFLASDTIEHLRHHDARTDGVVADIGGGPGYLAASVRQAGGRCVVIEYDEPELRLHGRRPDSAIVGDGQHLPLRDEAVDVVHCSNVLEHVPAPRLLVEEMVRALRVGGVGYLSFTPWLSPWGGHETSPWHYFGGDFAADRYRRRRGQPAKNLYGRNLFVLHLATVRTWLERDERIELLWDGPRYWPASWRLLSRAPGIGEAVSWNYLALFRRRV